MKKELFSQTGQNAAFFTSNRNVPVAFLKQLFWLLQSWGSAGCDLGVSFPASQKRLGLGFPNSDDGDWKGRWVI